VLRQLQAEGREATESEQQALARWSSWGALPGVFDEQVERFNEARTELRALLSAEEYAAARRTTINAHYTDSGYVGAVWEALEGLGFGGGTVLEPGCGSGTFVGMAPEGARMVGVELDPVTAGIAQALYPKASIRAESFAETQLPEGSCDAVVGNVPFGDVTLHDPRHNSAGHRIHNHFIVKSLHLTRPGGVVALVTSRYTLDSANPAARREMAELGDFLGAVRLPTGAHRRAAGTDVVTDVLLFRRREAGAERAGADFERSELLDVEGDHGLRVNAYFRAHPEQVLGELRVGHGDGGRPELEVIGHRAAGPALREALGRVVDRAREAGLVMDQAGAERPESAPVALLRAERGWPTGYITAGPERGFLVAQDGAMVPFEVPTTQAAELGRLLGVRDALLEVLEREAGSIDDTDELAAARRTLNERYDAYVAAHGPLNRFTERRTGRVDPETGEERYAQVRPRRGGFSGDPYAIVVDALEHFDPVTQTATKAAIMSRRVVARRSPQLGADTPADALAIALDTYGEVRLDEVARLLGVTPAEARAELGTLVFDEPGTDRLVPAAEYLSGNVRTKLAEAEAAAREETRFSANVRALVDVIPRDLRPDEIHAQLGAAWIAPRYVEAFLQEILEDPSVRVATPGLGVWEVSSQRSSSVAATKTWGIEKCSATRIAQSLLEQRAIRLYHETSDGERIFLADETAAANEKAREMNERFGDWVWAEPTRSAELVRTYNDRFNAIVPRSYDGVKLSLPGLAMGFAPRPHQVAAVARIIHEPAVGLFHEVGAGKTAEMVMGAMELKRLGLATKPVVVVPNHMLQQFTSEWLQLYPRAKLLGASNEDLERDKRRLFVAKCATGDWDAVVMTRGAFERIPMSVEVQQRYIQEEVNELSAARVAAKGMSKSTVKRVERALARAEERVKAKLDGDKDAGLTFERTGIDYLFVDEAHAYKNLRTASNIPGMAVDGSMRASDLHMKLEHLRSRGVRVGTLATATPIANSMGEAYTMQRYLRPDLLRAAGIHTFDQWGATFGQLTTDIEVTPDGSGMRMQSRFAKFKNVPELLGLWRVSADIKTAEDLQLPVPALRARASDGGRAPETVVVPPSGELCRYVSELGSRAEQVRSRMVPPDKDNMLSISSDGRAGALDLRLVGLETGEPQKVDVAAERIAAIYERHRETRYPALAGGLHPTPGALQIVFADLGTPKESGGRFSVYDELRDKLVERGLPRQAVRFIHEARNDREKGELFEACRDGRVAVLVGSTERMGVGTNVQLRAVALHHLDCPWRPADIAQREGRIVRQGNANKEVEILRYVTEGSFDAYLWQTVTRKAAFISQVMRGRLDVRELDDIGEATLSYNEVKALATGNPLLLEQAKVEAEVTRLERLARTHERNEASMRRSLSTLADRAASLDALAEVSRAAYARFQAHRTAPEAFRVRVGEQEIMKRTQANAALLRELQWARSTYEVAEVHGFKVVALAAEKERVSMRLDGVPDGLIEIDLSKGEGVNLLLRLENKLEGLEVYAANAVAAAERDRRDLQRTRREVGQPFKHAERLAEERVRLAEVRAALEAALAPPPAPKDPEALANGEAPSVPESVAPVAAAVEVAPASSPELAGTSGPVVTATLVVPAGLADGHGQAAPAAGAAARPPQGPAAASTLADPSGVVERWRSLYEAELAKVRAQAERVQTRIGARFSEIQERLEPLERRRPVPPRLMLSSSARAAHADRVRSWSAAVAGLKQRAEQLTVTATGVGGFLSEPIAGQGSAGTRAALARLKRREPDLARRVQAVVEARAQARASETLGEPARPRGHGR
jgi:N12 class adenine-specific DNA methylase